WDKVRSNQGHLANKDAAAFLVELCTAGVQHVVLAHLSETNNRPELVESLVCQELAQLQPSFSLDLARQGQPSRVITVGEINKE
ncbi:MAG: MBL fold metallo-hydrolase, partial [Candidatus Electrothrix sp. AUS4]|nr:MBL fold metallo-hydrolase [Candidatus Electrothrix sp. AUS4]